MPDTPFNLNQVLLMRGPFNAEADDMDDPSREPLKFRVTPEFQSDPFAIVEGIGWSGKRHYIQITVASGETYTVWESEFPQLVGTSVHGEDGLAEVVKTYKGEI